MLSGDFFLQRHSSQVIFADNFRIKTQLVERQVKKNFETFFKIIFPR